MAIFGFIFFIYTFSKDQSNYRLTQNRKSYASTFIFTALVVPSLLLGGKLRYEYTKPSLIKAVIIIDFTRLDVDLKQDGSFVFSNTCFIVSSYAWGRYTISGDTITLDRKNVDNVIQSDKMLLKEKEVEFKEGMRKELYLIALGAEPNDIYSDYKVTEDNR